MAARKISRKVGQAVQQDARYRLLAERAPGSNLYIDERLFRRGETIEAQHQKIPIERDTIVVFADDEPLLNWGHRSRYLLYRAEDQVLYRTVDAQFPAYLTEVPETFRPFHQPVVHARPDVLLPIKVLPRFPLPVGARWYAILFSGASNNRHTNDLEFLYRSLRSDYGVGADRIYVLNYDGTLNYAGSPQPATTWPGDNTAYTMPVNAAGTKSEFEKVLDDVATRLTPQDSLLIHTNNHGGHNGESYLVPFSGPSYGVADFAAKLSELPPFECLMVMMEQCFAGGFNGPILASSPAANTTVASAAVESNTSIGGAHFDPFAHDWIAAVHGSDADSSALDHDPDTNSDGCISAQEAFDYADSIHHPHDTPNYSASSSEAGTCCVGSVRVRWKIPDIYLMVERWWPGPWPEGLARVEEILPELEEIASDAARRFDRVERDMERRIRAALQPE